MSRQYVPLQPGPPGKDGVHRAGKSRREHARGACRPLRGVSTSGALTRAWQSWAGALLFLVWGQLSAGTPGNHGKERSEPMWCFCVCVFVPTDSSSVWARRDCASHAERGPRPAPGWGCGWGALREGCSRYIWFTGPP